MSSFTLTNMAKDRFKNDRPIYIQKKMGARSAQSLSVKLDTCFHQLAANPLQGKDCSEIRSGYHKFNAGSHIIFYRQTLPETIEIVHVLHEHMDGETRLSES
jgi:toxin ParE1/3/4